MTGCSLTMTGCSLTMTGCSATMTGCSTTMTGCSLTMTCCSTTMTGCSAVRPLALAGACWHWLALAGPGLRLLCTGWGLRKQTVLLQYMFFPRFSPRRLLLCYCLPLNWCICTDSSIVLLTRLLSRCHPRVACSCLGARHLDRRPCSPNSS